MKFKSSRGGKSQALDISCQKCDAHVLYYQKDGPGNLRRMYMDRIILPQILSDNQYENISDIEPLCCENCSNILGYPIVYKKENRNSYRLFVDSVIKKKVLLKDIK